MMEQRWVNNERDIQIYSIIHGMDGFVKEMNLVVEKQHVHTTYIDSTEV